MDKEHIILKLENDMDRESLDMTDVENFWKNIASLYKSEKNKNVSPIFSFEIVNMEDGASFNFVVPKKFKSLIIQKLNSLYTDITIREIEEDYMDKFEDNNPNIFTCQLDLQYHDIFPLKVSTQDKMFLQNLLNSMISENPKDYSLVQILIKPSDDIAWAKNAKKALEEYQEKGFKITNLKGQKSYLKVGSIMFLKLLILIINEAINFCLSVANPSRISNIKNDYPKQNTGRHINNVSKEITKKIDGQGLDTSIRIMTKSNSKEIASMNLKSIVAAFKELEYENKFNRNSIPVQNVRCRTLPKNTNRLSTSEMAQFIHLPHRLIRSENLIRNSVKLLFDNNISKEGILFGESNGNRIAFHWPPEFNWDNRNLLDDKTYKKFMRAIDDICKPRLILGQMGVGKSEWILNYMLALIKAGIGIILVDPKNDTQQRLIESLDEEFIQKTDYINIGDLEYPPALNLLRVRKGDITEKFLIIDSLITFFKKEFGSSWGFALEDLIRKSGNAILTETNSTIYEMQSLLINEKYRTKLIHKMESMLDDPNTKDKATLKECIAFWNNFNKMSESDRNKRISSTMNKLGRFLSHRVIRAIVSQQDSYDFRKAADEGRITIVNIPKGILGNENHRLMTDFINTSIWLDLQSRADIKIDQRRPVVWFIEEAHETMTDDFIGPLTQARGYRLGTVIVTQGLTNFNRNDQKDIQNLLLTNCKNKIIFRVGQPDARILSEEMDPATMFDLINCPQIHFYGKILLENGNVSKTFYAKSLSMAEKVREYEFFYKEKRKQLRHIEEIEEELFMRYELNGGLVVYDGKIDDDEEEKQQNKNQSPPIINRMMTHNMLRR